MKALKVRIYPDEEQMKFLDARFGAVRLVYNKALFIKKHLYQFHQINAQPIAVAYEVGSSEHLCRRAVTQKS